MEAAFFDLDKTIIAKSSVLAFGRSFYKEGLLSRRVIMRMIYGQMVYMLVGADDEKMERMREAMLVLTRGWEQSKVADIVRETMDDTIAPIVFAEAMELFGEHHAANRRVVIVSSSPAEIVRPLADFLGVDDFIATRASIDAEGRYTGDLAFYAYGTNKAEAIRSYAAREGIDLAGSFAYSDSVTDMPMLKLVGHPVAVNPDKELAREADKRGWETRNFRRTVQVHDRRAVPPPGPALAIGGGVVLVGTGVGVVLWLRRRRHGGAPTFGLRVKQARQASSSALDAVRHTASAFKSLRRATAAFGR